jgi:TamB, inner membrane protein subunit of TAM complex
VLLFSIPAVQTRLGKFATKKINDDFGTNISIEKVGLQLNGDVELKNIYIEDYKKDTLISIIELNTSIISFKKLYNNKLTFGDIDIEGLLFNLKTYESETDTNLDIFVAKFDTESSEKKDDAFLLSSSDVSITDSEFRLVDENREESQVFTFNDLNINATDFLILGPDVSTRINNLSFTDNRGIAVTNMITNFTYTLKKMTFDALQIKTANSTLKGDLKFEYNRNDLQYFVDKVKVHANFVDSDIALNDLNVFYNEFGINQHAHLNVSLYGTLNNLTANDLILRTSRQTIIDGDIKFKNLFNKVENTFVMDANFERLTSSYGDLKSILPRVLGNSMPTVLEDLKRFTIEGKTNVTAKTINADIEVSSGFGYIISNIEMQNIDTIEPITYIGNIVLDDFDIGALFEDPKIGKVSLDVDVNGAGFSADNINTQIKGEVFSLAYNNYEYKSTTVSGNVRNKIFDGNLVTRDNNLQLNFNGLIDFSEAVKKYDFTAQVDHANLKALNFAKNDSISIFKSVVKMNMNASNFDDAYGNVTFKNTLYKNENDEYYFKDFAISSKFKDNIRFIAINSPDIIEGDLNGKFVFKDVFKLIENSLSNIYTNFEPYDIEANQFINFNFKVYNKIAEVFYPDLKLGNNTFLKGRVESDAREFSLTFKSPQIQINEYFASKIQLKVDNKNPLFNTYIEVDSINTKYYNVSKFSLINVTKKDTLFVKAEFKGGKDNTDDFNLNLFYTINEESNSVFGFNKSNIIFKNNQWYINEEKNNFNKIVFDRQFKDVKIQGLKMSHQDEVINLYGVLKDSTTKNINLDFKDVDLIKITPRIDSLALAGNVNGKLSIQQQRGVYIPESNVTVDNFKVNNFNLGSFKANIKGNKSLTNYNINVSLKDDESESLAVVGNLDFSKNSSRLNLNVDFDTFILDPLNPFGEGVITNIRGEVSGTARVTGRLQRPQINGQLLLDRGGMSIPYLNVDYAFEDGTEIILNTYKQQQFVFNNARLVDSKYFSRSTLSGSINHVNFSNWSLDLNLNSDRLLVLNTKDSEDVLYYGTAFVSGNIGVTGPTNQLVIKADVSTEEGTVFKIPLNDAESFGDNAYIHFLTKEEKENRLKGEDIVLQEIKGLEMDFDLSVDDDAEIEIVIDKDSGSSIRGRGDGILGVLINTNGKFKMYGDFIVNEGIYNFVYGGLIQKEFEVLSGGSLVWEGDPLKAQINIEAVYDGIEANPSILLDNPINRSIPVEVKIHLTGELEKPDPVFDLSFPNVNTTLNSELQYRLNSDESKQFQALSLLATGNFKSDVRFDSQDWVGLFSDRASAIINDILSKGDGKIQLQLDYQIGDNRPEYQTDDRFVTRISTQLSDRILINGKVGVPIGGVNETVIAGDFEIEVLINEEGTFSLTFFNRENSIQNFGEQIGYTQGVGLSYNVEFDNLKELFQKIFKNTKKTKIKNKENSLPEFITFKQKDSKNTNKSNN